MQSIPLFFDLVKARRGFPGGSVGKESACRFLKETWVGKILWRRKWQPIQCSCLENSMDRAAGQAAVYGIAESRTQLQLTFAFKARKENGSLFSPSFRCCHREFLDLEL